MRQWETRVVRPYLASAPWVAATGWRPTSWRRHRQWWARGWRGWYVPGLRRREQAAICARGAQRAALPVAQLVRPPWYRRLYEALAGRWLVAGSPNPGR